RVALAAPFAMVWILPVVYWFGDRDRRGRVHEWVQALSFLCMGWLSFLLVLTLGRDVLLLATAALPPLAAAHTLLDEAGTAVVAALTTAPRGRRRGRCTSRRWDFACSATRTSPSRVARHAS